MKIMANKYENCVRFKHLSIWLKVAVITAWIAAGVYSLAFLVGFIQELML